VRARLNTGSPSLRSRVAIPLISPPSAAPAHLIIGVSVLAVVVAHHKTGVYSSTDQGGGKRRAISDGRQLRSLGDDGRLVHTNIPSVPGQMETNDTALAATNNRVWAGASAAGDANRPWARRETFRT
jgi:hypothetical protein